MPMNHRWSPIHPLTHHGASVAVWFSEMVSSHRIHGAAIYGNMDPINIPQMLAYIPYMDPMAMYMYMYMHMYMYMYVI